MRILIFCSFIFLSACSHFDDYTYKVTNMSLSNENNSGSVPFDSGTDSVPKKAYAIKLNLAEQIVSKTNADPYESGYSNVDRLSSFNIYSITNFDPTHLAGVSLNDYFLTALNSRATIASFISSGFIGGGRDHSGSVVDTWNTEQSVFLMTPPTAIGNYSFVVNAGLSDGRHFIDTVSVKLY